jgi:hypothetical protein
MLTNWIGAHLPVAGAEHAVHLTTPPPVISNNDFHTLNIQQTLKR